MLCGKIPTDSHFIIVLPDTLQALVFDFYHTSPYGCHLGFHKTNIQSSLPVAKHSPPTEFCHGQAQTTLQVRNAHRQPWLMSWISWEVFRPQGRYYLCFSDNGFLLKVLLDQPCVLLPFTICSERGGCIKISLINLLSTADNGHLQVATRFYSIVAKMQVPR